MKLGTFLSIISASFDVEEKTVKLFARNLREAGLMTTGARGKNSPDMLVSDLVVMTIALLGTDKPARAVEAFHYFAGMQVASEGHFLLVQKNLPDFDHTLLDLLNFLCDPTTRDLAKLGFTLSFVGTLYVTIERPDMTLIYHSRAEFQQLHKIGELPETEMWAALAEIRHDSPIAVRGMVVTREISWAILSNLALVIAAIGQPTEEVFSDLGLPTVKRQSPEPDNST